MKQTIAYYVPTLLRWICILAVVYIQMHLLPLDTAAQEPAAEPTATATPETSPTAGVPVAPTPTPDGDVASRLVDFRVDADDIEEGECVEFSWVARGDIDRIEFDQKDDDKDGVLVAALDDRIECPADDRNYELIVHWLDSSTIKHKIEINVHASATSNNGNDDDNDSNSSSSNSSGSSTTNTTAGVFVQVTPILITNTQYNIRVTPIPESFSNLSDSTGGAVEVIPASSGNTSAPPDGVLATIRELPETGHQPAALADQERQPRFDLWLTVTGSLALLSASFILSLILLINLLRQAS